MPDFKKIKTSRPVSDFDVVFDSQGNLCRHTDKYGSLVTEKNKVFADQLEYCGYFPSKGGNSHIKFKSLKSGRVYHMFMSDFDDVLDEHLFIDNQICGLFCFCKKGCSQGIRVVFENP